MPGAGLQAPIASVLMSCGGSFGHFPARRGRRMIAAVLAVAGLAGLAAGLLLLRGTGTAWRVGRLISAAPDATIEEAAALARAGTPRIVRLHGRVSSDEEFPDENDRPLVYRRARLTWTDPRGRVQVADDDRLAVPFGIEEHGAYIAVDVDALGDGLVVVPRVAEGAASELPEAIAAGLPAGALPADPGARVGLRVEQLSAVEHATAIGVPRLGPDGEPQLTAGLGRPLVITPLDPDAAMRVLAAGRRGVVKLASLLLVGGPALIAVAIAVAIAGA